MILKDIRYLITQNADRDIYEGVDVRVEDGKIAEIGENLAKDGAVLDCSDMAVMPGLINTHTHAPLNMLRGISDNKVLEAWLEEDIFPAEDQLTDDDIRYGTLHAIIEMLQSGTTCFNSMYAPEAGEADAVDEAGIRAVLGKGLMGDMDNANDSLQTSKQFIESYQDHDRITPAVNPHAIYTCSEDLLREAQAQAQKYDTPLHIHVSETVQENQDCREEHGMSPTQHLDELGLVTDRMIAAHSTHLSNEDMQVLAERGAAVAHNPCANMKLGSGTAPIPGLQKHGVTVGLGTDSVASNNNLNMFEEMKFASLLQKEQNATTMPEQTVLDMATRDAAAALGLDDQIGSIEEGKQADLLTINLHDVTLNPRYGKRGLLSNLVFAFNGPASDVFVEGEQLLHRGRPVTVNPENVREAASACIERVQNS